MIKKKKGSMYTRLVRDARNTINTLYDDYTKKKHVALCISAW